MLNARLYRTCWLVAGVALVVALLTLESPDVGTPPSLPSTLDGQSTLELSNRLEAIAPSRPPGSESDVQSAAWVREQLSQLPGSGRRVQVQQFQARARSGPVDLRNVYLAVPGSDDGHSRAGIVVVAPRDTPEGIAAGTSATAVLLRLARASATTRHQRPHLFVSTDGSTIGNAGLRWFLSTFRSFPIGAVVALDAPGEVGGDRIHVWSDGRTNAQALRLAEIARRSIERVGARGGDAPGLTHQLLRLAVPQSLGEQGAAIADGIPAVTLSGREESPLRQGREPTAERMEMVANAGNDLLGVLDASTAIPSADTSLAVAGRVLRPTIARLALLLLALPLLVAALDAAARARRAKVSLVAGLRAVGLRAVPILAALAAAHALSLPGLMPRSAAGALPIPADAGFGAGAGLALMLTLVAGVLGGLWARRRARAIGAEATSEATAALLALAVLLLALWIVSPYALVLALPAAHAGLVASAARRTWHVAAAALVALAPLLALAVSVGRQLDANPFYALWYLLDTIAGGARGATGPVVAALICACVWSLAALVLFRARKGGFALAGGPEARAARRRERRRRAREQRRPSLRRDSRRDSARW